MGKTPLQNSSKKRKIVFGFCFLVFMLFGLCATTNADNCLSLYREGRYTEAIQCYDEVIRENISSNVVGSAWFQKGICLSNLGNIDEAVAAMDEAAKVDPQYTGFSSALYPDYKRISESTEMNTMVEDSNDAASWNDKGNVLAMRGKYDAAIEAFDEALRLNPNEALTWSNKGNTLSMQGKHDEAIKAFDEAIRLDPNDAGTWNNKGMDLYDQGKFDEAISAFDEAIRLKPNYTRAQQNKADASNALAQQNKIDAIMEQNKDNVAVKEKLGPYNVSFILTNTSLEANSSASKWGNPFSDEDTGYAEGTVHIVPKERTNYSVAMITVMESNSGMEYDTSGSSPAENLEKSGWGNIQISTRTIDGDKTATLVSADSPTLKGNSIYWVTYRINKNVVVDIQSWIPMNKGTEDLLNTIHVARTAT